MENKVKLKIINPINVKNWDDFLIEKSDASIFHTSLWAKTLFDTYYYTPMYLLVKNGNSIEFLLPIMSIKSSITGCRGSSLPFTDFCEPLGIHGKFTCNQIIDYIKLIGERKGWNFIEFRGGSELFKEQKYSVRYFGHTLKLTDESILFSQLKENTRRNIKKGNREGVKAIIQQSASAMEEFYRLNCLTRKRHGLPPQPIRFFRNIYNYIIQNDLGIIVNGVFQNKTIASAVYFNFKKQVIYKYGASDHRYHHLRANNLVMWEAIKHYSRKGYNNFNFGKTDVQNEGLRRYKLSWGTSENTIKYYKYNLNRNCFISDRTRVIGWYNYFFRKMPIPFLKILGNVLYRHVG
jgi:hypothetical protein